MVDLSPILGWLGNVFLVVGLWQIGNRRRWAFLLTVTGEVIWTTSCLMMDDVRWDMVFICALFSILALRNWWCWGCKEKLDA